MKFTYSRDHRVRVTYDSSVLGRGVFWEGAVQDIHQIRNVVACELAERVAHDGQQRTVGMWTAQLFHKDER